jgi:hypothetical protein
MAFRLVIGRVIYKAILLIADDWQGLKIVYDFNRRLYKPLKTCNYELPLRYNLPCAYRLFIYLVTGALIDLTLFYRRWHLDGGDAIL